MKRALTILKRAGTPLAVAGLVLAALVAGYVFRGCIAPGEPEGAEKQPAEAEASEPLWTCSMHPQIKLPEPGLCPICNMELVRLDADAAGPRTFKTSEAAKKLMGIRVHPVERRFVTAEVRMPGKVTYNETRLARITAWVPGRIDRLYVDFTGISVREGDHMVYLYSPELYSAQEELLQAIEALDSLKASDLAAMKETAKATVEAAREKLRLLGMTKEQMKQVEQRGTAKDHATIHAPTGGIVVERHADEGQYVRTGSPIYTIADLSHLWVMLDAYETDLPWLHYGQEVVFEAKGYPDETFVGKIAFISPVVDDRTRTVKVRVNVPNPEMKLKPDMFVQGVVRSKLATGGRVMAPDLAGKWMCPMHPSVVKDAAGTCDICGMPLARTESLGYTPADPSRRDKPLVIPKSAPLITGKRAVVYVKDPGADEPTYVGRTIKLGPRAGDWYIVEDGLAEGELVVVRGNFKIDSALQIQGKASMMSVEGGDVPGRTGAEPTEAVSFDAPPAFREQLGHVVEAYFDLSEALVGSDRKKAGRAAEAMKTKLAAVDPTRLADRAAGAWRSAHGARIRKALALVAEAETLEEARRFFATLSDELAGAVRRFGVAGPNAVYRIHCPMAFGDAGADWLQPDEQTRNPYYGDKMLRCGNVVETLHETKAAAAFREQLGDLLRSYYALSEALADDEFAKASKAAGAVRAKLENVDPKPLTEPQRATWQKEVKSLRSAATEMSAAEQLAGVRSAFALFSDTLAASVDAFGVEGVDPVYKLHCPMAFNNRGADWLQPKKAVRNPYYGSKMLTCGEVVEVLHGD